MTANLRCKPGSLATVIGHSQVYPCAAKCHGVPVRVTNLQVIVTRQQAILEQLDGPVWMLESPMHCPFHSAGCIGIDRMPDRCLRPFDPGSEVDGEPEDKAEPVDTKPPVSYRTVFDAVHHGKVASE